MSRSWNMAGVHEGMLLKVEGLHVAYQKLMVLFQVSMEVAPGEVVVIVGRNAAGKTTLFRTVAGFLKKETGTVLFKGADIGGLRAYQVARLGLKYVPQDKQVFSNLKVRENLELGGYATRDYDWDGVLSYFPKLQTLLDRKAGHLSGGERQMLMIARALLGSPELLLLDEPTEGLAPLVVVSLLSSFKKIKEKTTLAIVEQNLPMTGKMADRVYCLKEGKVVAEIRDKQQIRDLVFERWL
jgi:ABC-type branched-subunit amino acid transport system ATPase component